MLSVLNDVETSTWIWQPVRYDTSDEETSRRSKRGGDIARKGDNCSLFGHFVAQSDLYAYPFQVTPSLIYPALGACDFATLLKDEIASVPPSLLPLHAGHEFLRQVEVHLHATHVK